MYFFVITFLNQILSTESGLEENKITKTLEAIEEEYFTINNEAVASIIQTTLFRYNPEKTTQEDVKTINILEFFRLQTELCGLLLTYYEIKNNTRIMQERMRVLENHGQLIKQTVKKLCDKHKVTFYVPSLPYGRYLDLYEISLPRYKEKVLQELLKNDSTVRQSKSCNILANDEPVEQDFRLLIELNAIIAAYKYTRIEFTNLASNYRGIVANDIKNQIGDIEKKIEKFKEFYVDKISLKDIVIEDMKKVKKQLESKSPNPFFVGVVITGGFLYWIYDRSASFLGFNRRF